MRKVFAVAIVLVVVSLCLPRRISGSFPRVVTGTTVARGRKRSERRVAVESIAGTTRVDLAGCHAGLLGVRRSLVPSPRVESFCTFTIMPPRGQSEKRQRAKWQRDVFAGIAACGWVLLLLLLLLLRVNVLESSGRKHSHGVREEE